jgi:hypothetical protein
MNEYSREERLLLGRGDSTGDMRAFARTQPSGASHDRVRTADGEAFLDGGARAAARREQRLQVERIRATREQQRQGAGATPKKKKKPVFSKTAGKGGAVGHGYSEEDAPLLDIQAGPNQGSSRSKKPKK